MAKRTCAVDACEKAAVAHGWCPTHLYRWRKHGTTDLPARPTRPEICTVDGCTASANQPGTAKGLCRKHYARFAKHGDPNVTLITIGNAPTCTIPGCEGKHLAKGLCGNHYAQHREAQQDACTVDGCTKPQRSKGLCNRHYHYLITTGSLAAEFECAGCGSTFPGRKNSLYCAACQPAPHFYAARRRARLAQNNEMLGSEDRSLSAEYRQIIAVDPCVYCGNAAQAIDHIIPVVEGGSDRWDNLAPICRDCNSAKRTRSLLEVLLARR